MASDVPEIDGFFVPGTNILLRQGEVDSRNDSREQKRFDAKTAMRVLMDTDAHTGEPPFREEL